jgi:hypothetical protein
MKKRTLKKVLQFGILLFGIPLLLWNCEKEDMKASIVLQELDDKYHSRTITLDDIYDVKKHLDDLMPQQRDINKTSEVEGAIFDEEHVLEVIDTLQNTNYSLRFTYPDTPLGEFYNLVIGRTPEGVLKTPFVLKYTCDNNFLENYIAHDFDIHYFEGMVKMHVYTDFFSVDAFSKTTDSCPPEFDAVGDPVACEENPIGIGTGSGGSGGSSGGTGGSSGGTGGSSGGTGGSSGGTGGSSGGTGGSSGGTGGQNISLTCTCVGHSVTQINDGTCTCTSYVLEIFMTRSNNRTANDCPSCASSNPIGGIGVNEPNISSMIGNIKNALDLNSSELVWLHNDATNGDIMAIDLYINMNSLDGSLSNEAKEFGEQAITIFLDYNNTLTFNELIIALEYEQDYRSIMSTSELTIFESISRTKQLAYLFNAQKALWKADELFISSIYNGKGDAFRHAYFNALNTILLGSSLAESLSTAHEDKPPFYQYNYKENQMDLFNNEIGRARSNWLSDGYSSQVESIIDAIETGELRYLSHLEGGGSSGRATALSQLIPTNN